MTQCAGSTTTTTRRPSPKPTRRARTTQQPKPRPKLSQNQPTYYEDGYFVQPAPTSAKVRPRPLPPVEEYVDQSLKRTTKKVGGVWKSLADPDGQSGQSDGPNGQRSTKATYYGDSVYFRPEKVVAGQSGSRLNFAGLFLHF